MIEDVQVTGHGRAATELLAAVVRRAQAGRPLAPVTVVVPSNLAGLSARRLLGSGAIGGRGVANVRFLTPLRLAELLSADLPSQRRPITNPVLASAVRLALAEESGPFAQVAGHHATEEAFSAMYAELSHVSELTLCALDRCPGSSGAAVAIFRKIGSYLEGFEGEDDLARSAAGRSDLAPSLRHFGHVVWFLPEPMTPALTQLVGSVLRAAHSSVIVGMTGDPEADAAVVDVCARAGVVVTEVVDLAVPVGTHVVSVTDSDEEVRAVVRRIAQLAELGVRLDRIGVFYPTPDPYLLTLQAQLAEAGMPANGPSRERLLDSVAGRTLLGALALPAGRWRRDRVMALVSGAPVRHGEQPTYPSAWEELSRAAGVVRDIGEWRDKLAARRRMVESHLADLHPAQHADRAGRLARECQQLDRLASFVEELASGVRAVSSARGWAARSDHARRLLRQLLGSETHRGDWPEAEQDAAVRVEDALSRLAALDELEPNPSFEVFQRALTAELDVVRGRVGRFGQGVFYGPLAAAVGHDLDAVFILGLAEGWCPAPRRDDALIPDTARARAVPGELVLQADKIHHQHRAFLAALASAPPPRRYLSFPRGDLRGGRHRLPSRWLLDTAGALAGRTIHSTDFAHLGAPLVEEIASYPAGLRTAASPASTLDRDVATLAAHVFGGGDPAHHPVASGIGQGLRCLAGRRSGDLTIWDGDLAGLPVPSPAEGQLLSATGLERWAACGFRYFLASVLGLGDRDDPERIVDLGALDRGSGVHEILERFFGEVIGRGAPDPDAAWSSTDRARLQEIADEVFARLERAGRTGRPVHWRLERQRLAGLLENFLTADEAFRASRRSRPGRVELPFGLGGAPPVTVDLPDRRALHFAGRADRVDVTDDGRLAVIDYKTGRGGEYARIAEGDPVQGGTTLQLGLYSEAASQLLGVDRVSAEYWMVNEETGFAHSGYPWTEDRRHRFVDVVTGIVDGIEAGMFAAVPGAWDSWRNTNDNCVHCSFDSVCPKDRGSFSEAKAAAPQLERRRVLEWNPDGDA